jgi:RND family efflux transporter MFP subunit
MKKFFTFVIVMACFGLIGWKVYQKVSATENHPMRSPGAIPVPVNVEPIRKASVQDVISFTGTLYPRSQFMVAPKVGGRLESLMVNIGDYVQQGQLIAVLDDDEYIQQVGQAKAELEVAEARIEETRGALDIARRELERAKELRQKDISSQSAFDTAQARYNAQVAILKSAEAQYAQKKASLKAAEIRLSYTQIRASWTNGDEFRVVGERFVDEGALLTPNAPIVSILENNILTAVVYVIERDYPKIRTNQPSLVSTDAFPGRSFNGRVIRVAPILKETSRQARVDIEVPNPGNLLKPGMFVRIQIELDRHNNATVVPMAALVKKDGIQGVFMADIQENKAGFVPVTLGIVQDELAEIIKPSLNGLVVTLGQHLLEDGSTIILPGAGPERQQINKDGAPRTLEGGRP